MELTARQSEILRRLVEEHVGLGAPVGSKWLHEHGDMPWGPSTIRAELARLEELGLLRHPHTSAGRVPTDRGYRHYADELLDRGELPAPPPALALGRIRREIDEAVRATTEQLSQVTNLLALVTTPPIGTTTIRHIEVLQLQPQVAMVVVIASTGGVTKRVVTYERPLDPGLVDWAGSYLNEALAGMALGARMVQARLTDPGLSDTERAFLDTLAPAFTELEDGAEETLHVEGTARLLTEDRVQELEQINDILGVLEQRVGVLQILRSALEEPHVYLRIGAENEVPALRSVSIVAANYGLPTRNLGAVSVLGPVRMDYATAISSVQQAAGQLSRFVADLYER